LTRAHAIDGWRIDVTVRPGIPRVVSGAEAARVIATALAAAGAPRRASLTVVLTDDAELAELNATHLGHDGPTDVLSFPLLAAEAYPPHAGRAASDSPDSTPSGASFVLPPRARPHLGDIAISVERAIAQASDGRGGHTGTVRWSAASEMRLLLTHGALHVCGWDHAEKTEETAMRALERALLGDVPA
jgi:probable rRNA maturation factor